MSLSAIILSAGEGSRVGGNKALLRYGGQTFLERVSEAIRASTVCDEILVVTGFDHGRVVDEALRLQLKSVYNPQAATGLMTSLQAGLREVRPEAEAILVALVDQPLITGDFIATFFEAYTVANAQAKGRYTLARPYYHDRPGHPGLIARAHFNSILAHGPTDEGANYLFKENPETVFQYITEDRAAATDIDTADDLRGLLHAPR